MPGDDARLRALEDREAIRNLIAAYGPLADSGDAAGVAGLFTDDGEYDIGGWGVLKGTTQLADAIDNPNHRAWMAQGVAHVLSPPVIVLNGDSAIARNHSVVFLRDSGGHMRAERVAANRWELVRLGNGQWKIARRINRLLDGGGEATELLKG